MRDELGRGRHDLHQALRADGGTRAHDEARLLTDQPVDPGFVQAKSLGRRMHQVFERGGETLAEIHFDARAVRGADHAVEHVVLAREFGGGEQLPFAHLARFPIPFAVAFGAQIQVVKAESATKALVLRHRQQLIGSRRLRARRHSDHAAQFLLRQLAVEIDLRGDRLELQIRLVSPALLLQGAAVPIDPGWVRAHFFRHGGDPGLDHFPVAGTQGGAHAPGEFGIGQGRIAGAAPIIDGVGRKLERGLIGDLGPADGLLVFR